MRKLNPDKCPSSQLHGAEKTKNKNFVAFNRDAGADEVRKKYLAHSRAGPSQPESDAPVVLPQAHFACPVFTAFKCLGTSSVPISARENGGGKKKLRQNKTKISNRT